MSHEIVYTSAPQGLKPGSKGFCTVVSTDGIAANISERLEMLSGYRHAFTPGDCKAPVNYSHLHIKVSGQRYYVLSRICDAGLDYSQRSNKLAHHVALAPNELVIAGPAAVLAHDGFCEKRWDGNVRTLPTGRRPNAVYSKPSVCSQWKRLAGDAGWAGVLADSATRTKQKPVSVIVPVGTNSLVLVVEALNLISPARRWNVTFNTYYTKPIAGSDCLWRFVLDGTKQAASLRHSPTMHVVDLCGNPGPPPETPFSSSARSGRPNASYSDQFSVPSATENEPVNRMLPRRQAQLSPPADTEYTEASGQYGAYSQYQGMPVPPELPGRRIPWHQRKITWILTALMLLSCVGGLVAAAYYAGQNSVSKTPPLPIVPADRNPPDGNTQYPKTNDVTTSQTAAPPETEEDTGNSVKSGFRQHTDPKPATTRQPHLKIRRSLGSDIKDSPIDPLAKIALEKLPSGLIPLVVSKTDNTVSKSLPLDDLTRCSLEILLPNAADKSAIRALRFQEQNKTAGNSLQASARVWTAEMDASGGGKPTEIGTFTVDGSNFAYQSTGRNADPRVTVLHYSLLKLTVDERSEIFSFREPETAPLLRMPVADQHSSVEIRLDLPGDFHDVVATALQFDLRHEAVKGFELSGLRFDDSFLLAFSNNGALTVETAPSEMSPQDRANLGVLADVKVSLSVIEPAEGDAAGPQSGQIVLTVTPAVYLKLLNTSGAPEFAKQFLAGSLDLISSVSASNWNMEDIAIRLSMEDVRQKIYRRIRREINHKRTHPSNLEINADNFFDVLRNEIDGYYDTNPVAGLNRNKLKKNVEILIKTVENYGNTLQVLSQLKHQLEEKKLHVRAYTVNDGQPVDVLNTKAVP